MIIPSQDFDHLLYLADEIESGDYFEKHAQEFSVLLERLKDRIYQQCDDSEVLDMADRLPAIEFQPYRRSFFEQMLPKAGRDMVGKYKTKEKIRATIRESISGLESIRRLLEED